MVFNLCLCIFYTDVFFFKVLFLHLEFSGPLSNPLILIEYLYIMQTHRKMPKDQKTVSESPPSEIEEVLVPVEPRPYGTFNTVWGSFVFFTNQKLASTWVQYETETFFIFYNPLNTTFVNTYWTMFQIRDVYDESGVTGFWKGVIPTLIMVCKLSRLLKLLWIYCLCGVHFLTVFEKKTYR